MNYKDDGPENLGGLGDLLPAEVLKKVNELLEQLHQKDKDHQGSKIEIVYVASGGQHVENQYNIEALKPLPNPASPLARPNGTLDTSRTPLQKERGTIRARGEKEAYPDPPEGREKGMSNLPEVLATDKAMALWQKAQQAGYVDEQYLPLISRTQAALLADAMAERLGIKEKWKVFEGLWRRRNMYRDYYDAMNQDQTYMFLDKLKELFG